MSTLLSESEALRKCNLPSTSRWREWLRSKIQPTETSTGKFYDGLKVDALASRIAEFAAATAQPQNEQ